MRLRFEAQAGRGQSAKTAQRLARQRCASGRRERSDGTLMDVPNALRSGQAEPGRRLGYQCWCDLLFVHWRLPIAEVQCRLPPGLSVDPWQGDAWLGLVAFRLRGVRPWWFPAVPVVSTFLEINLRTYVRCAGGASGVWFFSMDAASTAAVLIGRVRWNLNYHRAAVKFCRSGERLHWSSRRLWPKGREAHLALEAEVPPPKESRLADDAARGRPARAGTLEHFLVERYRYYALSRSQQLVSGIVAHAPYRLLPSEVLTMDQTLTDAAGFCVSGPPAHACYCLGVASTVYPPLPTRAGSTGEDDHEPEAIELPASASSARRLPSPAG